MKKNRLQHLFFLLAILLPVYTQYGQEKTVDQYRAVPVTEAIPVILYQNRSPIVIERFVVVRDKSNQVKTLYSVRNTSNKPVKSYTIARLYDDSSGYVGGGAINGGPLLLPGATASNFEGDILDAVKPNWETKSTTIAFALITEVVFSDGSKIDLSDDFKALERKLI